MESSILWLFIGNQACDVLGFYHKECVFLTLILYTVSFRSVFAFILEIIIKLGLHDWPSGT